MPWRGRLRKSCIVCELPVEVVGPLSARGKCWMCGGARLNLNNEQLEAKEGPFYDHWARRMALYGRRLMMELAERER